MQKETNPLATHAMNQCFAMYHEKNESDVKLNKATQIQSSNSELENECMEKTYTALYLSFARLLFRLQESSEIFWSLLKQLLQKSH